MSWLDILKWLFGQISEKWKDETKSTNGENSTGHQPKLAREDVLGLIKENGVPEGLDLSGYDLSGVDLTKLDLHGVIFGNLEILLFATDKALARRANLEGTWFERSNLQRANFGRANLRNEN